MQASDFLARARAELERNEVMNGLPHRSTTRTRLDTHIYFPRELQLLFPATGFAIEAIYGGYDWKPFGQGTRQIVVGRKR